MSDLTAIRERLAKATPGPLFAENDDGVWTIRNRAGRIALIEPENGHDARLFAHARADLETLLLRVEESERERDRLREVLDHIGWDDLGDTVDDYTKVARAALAGEGKP